MHVSVGKWRVPCKIRQLAINLSRSTVSRHLTNKSSVYGPIGSESENSKQCQTSFSWIIHQPAYKRMLWCHWKAVDRRSSLVWFSKTMQYQYWSHSFGMYASRPKSSIVVSVTYRLQPVSGVTVADTYTSPEARLVVMFRCHMTLPTIRLTTDSCFPSQLGIKRINTRASIVNNHCSLSPSSV